MRRARCALFTCAVLGGSWLALPLRAQARDTVLMEALRDELARSMSQLRLDSADAPYFIAYTVRTSRRVQVAASYGTLLREQHSADRRLEVEVRVGNHTLDNSNFVDLARYTLGGDALEAIQGLQLPLEANYVEIRRQVWLATDAAYKRAIETLNTKRGVLAGRQLSDTTPDFSAEPVTHTIATAVVPATDIRTVEQLVRTVSFATTGPGIQRSRADLDVDDIEIVYVNSEGTGYTRLRPVAHLKVTAQAQADDGMSLSDALDLYASTLAGLPAAREIGARAQAMCARLDSLRRAPVFDRYTGPTLFEGRAAAEVVAERLAPAIEGQPKPLMGQSTISAAFDLAQARSGTLTLADRIGEVVLPTFLRVIDDPTAVVAEGDSLLGTYRVDEEGVSAQRTIVVDSGVLKTLLTTRAPIPRVAHSTGNDRGGSPAPSNLFVETDAGRSIAALEAELDSLVQRRRLPFGLVVTELDNGSSGTGNPMEFMQRLMGQGGERTRPVLAVYELYPDGRRQLVRGAHVAMPTLDAFQDIAAASSTQTVYDAARSQMDMGWVWRTMAGVAGGNAVPLSSYVVPALLFNTVTFSHSQGELGRPPFDPPPEASAAR